MAIREWKKEPMLAARADAFFSLGAVGSSGSINMQQWGFNNYCWWFLNKFKEQSH